MITPDSFIVKQKFLVYSKYSLMTVFLHIQSAIAIILLLGVTPDNITLQVAFYIRFS